MQADSSSSHATILRSMLRRILLFILFALALWALHRLGARLDESLPAAKTPAHAAARPEGVLLQVLLALVAVIVLGQLLGRLFAQFAQPPVIGEVVAGILLGPSVIGMRASELVLPAEVAPYLSVLAQLGAILFLFIVGLEFNFEKVRPRARQAVAISVTSVALPFALGLTLAWGFYDQLSDGTVSLLSFGLFVGVALSITAFPVLARILIDSGLSRTRLGTLSLACAALNDLAGWCLLAFAVSVAGENATAGARVALSALGFLAVVLLIVRPVAGAFARHIDSAGMSRSAIAAVLVAVLVAALTTEYIGIHAIFGAFLLGAIIPHDSLLTRTFSKQLEPIVTTLFLPAFFAFTGMRTRIDMVHGLDQWLLCGLIILLATSGKIGGAMTAARWTGMGWREGAALGALMNTRGLMELIVLNIGLDLRIITPTLFSMMVVMALVTTVATTPLVSALAVRDEDAETG